MTNKVLHIWRLIGLSGLMFFCLTSPVQAQGLRHSVCVVYPEITPEDSTFLAEYALLIAREGKTAEARQITSYLHGSFGSGVLTDSCVLTNQHVVGYARYAKLVFHLHDETLTFPHCKVLAMSAGNDLAAIALPDSQGKLVPLAISSAAPAEEENITAAGFPGLQNKPSWQLTRGYISNASLDLEDHTWKGIQHTAPVDPGSSGGPLLRKNDSGKYEIVGLNTLKAFYRDRVCIAVPASEIQRFWSARETDGFNKLDELKASLEEKKEAEHKRLNSVGIEDDLRNKWSFLLAEDWYSPNEHIVSLNIEYSGSHYMLYSFTFGAPIVPGTGAGITGGFRFGGYLPVRLNENNYLIPRVSVGLQIGTLFPTKPMLCYFPVKAGFDYRYQFSKTSLILGIEYVFRPTINSSASQIFTMRHGLSARVGVAL